MLNFHWSRFNFESGNDKQRIEPINLLQAVRLFKNSWDLVKNKTIVKCFKKAFPNARLEDMTEKIEEVDFSPVAIRGLFSASITLCDYLQANDHDMNDLTAKRRQAPEILLTWNPTTLRSRNRNISIRLSVVPRSSKLRTF